MPRFSYRNKLRLKKLLRFLLILLATLVAVSIVLLIYVEPYVVYDREGVHLEFPDDEAPTAPPVTKPRPVISNPQILYSEDPIAEKTIAETGGYYITAKMLKNPQAVLGALKSIPEPCAVFIELKSVYGNFYYSTGIAGAPTASVDIATVDEIIRYLRDNHFYMIGVVPAFCDSAFALENTACGLPLKSGALWMDSNNCYWLDPADDLVKGYLMEIARELSALGFNEIALDRFLFPESNKIVYKSSLSKTDILQQTISELNAFSQGSSIKISFVTEDTAFPAQEVTGRLYFPNVDGSKVELYARSFEGVEGISELVFLANSRDTRFEGRAQLRPLLSE